MKQYSILLLALLALLAQPLSAVETGDIERGRKAFGNCSACHQIGENAKNGFGPMLNNIVGRKGSLPNYTYSTNLTSAKDKGLIWSKKLLFEWLANPSDFLKKFLKDDMAVSKMPVMFKDEQLRSDVIAYLSSINENLQVMEMSHGNATHGLQSKIVRSKRDGIDKLPHIRQELVAPPFLPKHNQKARGTPKVIEVDLTVTEKEWTLDNEGTKFHALTFNGSIPAPIIVVHQNDYVQLTLRNPASNVMAHNIDLHAVTGALGGAEITTVTPGEQSILRFKAEYAGVFLYHCAPEGVMTPYHVTHGMTGAIMVLPRDGLKDEHGKDLIYDKAYFIGENEFYVPRDKNGAYKSYSETGEDLADWVDEMRGLLPSHIVFNGSVGALTGKKSLKATIGENVLFIHMQANRDSRPHLIGGHGDYVWETGAFSSKPLVDQETWFIRGGSVGAALHKFKQPGTYVYLNHNLIEAVLFGAAAHIEVEGEWNDLLTKQVYRGPIIKMDEI